MSLKSYAQTLRDAAEKAANEAAEKARTEGATRMSIAEAFDSHAAQLPPVEMPRPIPWHVFPHSYKHTPTIGRLSFKGQGFDAIAQMLQDCPPLPQTRYRASARRESGIRHPEHVPEYADSKTPTDGVQMRLGGGVGYGQSVAIEWATMMQGVCVEISAEVEASHQFKPRIAAKHNEWQGQVVSIDASTARLVYPFGDTSGLDSVRYAQGSKTAYPDFLVWGRANSGGLAAFVRSVAAEMLRLRVAGFAAYLADKREGLPPAETAGRISGMSAGSPAQNAALDSIAARKDRALAEKHWREYARDSEPETWPVSAERGYFDHYSWACHWLQMHGLLEDPAFIRKNGKPYKYGSAWINANGSIHGE